MPSFSLDEYLKTFLNWESKLHQASSAAFSLERVEKLLHIFGRPDDKLRFAHIAGTKGKGSSAAFLASILRASGYRVGLYTSPHLHSLCERIRTLTPGDNGRPEAGALPPAMGRDPFSRQGAAGQDPLASEDPDIKGSCSSTPRPASPPSTCLRQDGGCRRARPSFRSSPLMSDVPLALSGCVSLQQIADILRYYQEDIDELRASGVEITFYELMTVVAVFYFAQQDVDIVVLETGLGGRFDATNIFETSVCGITPIGFDHMNVLGNTLTAIAGEKAGIIRSPLQRVVLAPQAVEAMAVLKARCDGFGIRPEVVGVDIPLAVHAVTADGVSFDVEGRRKYTGLISPLTGRHQAENAALAIGMAEDLETFGFVITEKAVQEGVASVQWPARFEKVGVSPIVILDCAHTQESAQALADTFMASYPGEKAIIVVGMSSDKDADGFLEALKPIAQALVFTKADNPRAMDFLNSIEPVSQALIEARRLAGKDGIILVTGSVFICAEARG